MTPPVRSPNEHFLLSFDSTPIHYWLWPAADPTPKPPILIVHGAGEYAGRYAEFADFLNREGFAVAALDLRGFGQSGGPRAYVRAFSDYTKDVEAVAAQLLSACDAKRFILIGHSMGGLIAAMAAAEAKLPGLAGLALSSPCFALSFPVPAHLKAIGAVLSNVYPQKLFATKAISELLTHDKAIAQKHRTDPGIVHFMSARLFFEMNSAMKRFMEFARRIDLPTSVYQAGDDRVVNARASRTFFETLKGPQKRWMIYPGLFHEILNESSRNEVHRDFLSFLNSI